MPVKVLVAQIMHETNTFAERKTSVDDFKSREYVLGQEILENVIGANNELSGFLDAAKAAKWLVTPVIATEATPSGALTQAAMDHFEDLLFSAAEGSDFDGFFLALHGAMVAENELEADARMLEVIRKAVGADPIGVVSLDMHANLSQRLLDSVDGVVAYKTYPHVDQRETGARAFTLMEKAFKSSVRPRCQLYKLPMLDGCDNGRTYGSLMPALLQLSETDVGDDVHEISLFPGFPWTDVPHVGPGIVVTETPGSSCSWSLVCNLLDHIWQHRAVRSVEVVSPRELVSLINSNVKRGRSTVVADLSDNPGGGAPGDLMDVATELLGKIHCDFIFGTVFDPDAVSAAMEAGAGSEIFLSVGGKQFAPYSGKTLSGQFRVCGINLGKFRRTGPMNTGGMADIGPVATLSMGNMTVVVASKRLQVTEPAFFYCAGLDPSSYGVVLVKSHQHFRAAFESMFDEVLYADAGGMVSFDYGRLPYRRVRRPIWPLDDVTFDSRQSFVSHR